MGNEGHAYVNYQHNSTYDHYPLRGGSCVRGGHGDNCKCQVDEVPIVGRNSNKRPKENTSADGKVTQGCEGCSRQGFGLGMYNPEGGNG